MAIATVENIVISSLYSVYSLGISWDYSIDPTVIGYNIYRGNSIETDAMTKLNATAIGVNMYVDTTVVQELVTNYYYSVTAVSLAEESIKSTPVTLVLEELTTQTPVYYALKEIINRHTKVLEFDGEDCVFLIKKRIGTRCPCWREADQRSFADCATCYGTGIVGGYDKLSGMRFRYLDKNFTQQLVDIGLRSDVAPTGWVSDFPLLNQDDVVVRLNNKRYWIVTPMRNVHAGIITQQNFELKEIEPFHYIYNFEA